MKENLQSVQGSEMRKNLVTGVIAGGMLGLALGFAWKSIIIGLATGVLVGFAIGFRLGRMPIKMRYPMGLLRRMVLSGTLFMATSFGFAILIDLGISHTELILASILPIVAWAFFIISIGTAIASLDELQRRIQTEAIAIGFAGTVVVCGGYGLLGVAGLVPPLNWGLAIFVMVFMWFIGKMWTMWRYR